MGWVMCGGLCALSPNHHHIYTRLLSVAVWGLQHNCGRSYEPHYHPNPGTHIKLIEYGHWGHIRPGSHPGIVRQLCQRLRMCCSLVVFLVWTHHSTSCVVLDCFGLCGARFGEGLYL